MAEKLRNDCVIIASSCGKFRFNDVDFGQVLGTEGPRHLDLWQCNRFHRGSGGTSGA